VKRGRLVLAVVVVALVEALFVLLLRSPGQRLRPLVDLYAMEGLLLAMAGSFLVAERPFLAARILARRRRGDDVDADSEREGSLRRRGLRATGVEALLAGAVLFGVAALAWAVAGT